MWWVMVWRGFVAETVWDGDGNGCSGNGGSDDGEFG